ncbi:cytochrome c/c1 heme lyase domain-containing protein [Trichoderma breve]|uniref:Holocytochrome c-type synthase n=1 Tax=Trichoderma breve TaxID=2034170 RepID=A0A9W9BAP4_9HYPO|nr:cytochrome c/c1 heme lyase domain-containing protein [Trichoderma breve]KAJ4859645.1 cytochrome c/c1 heme lyase domain-containing protein [Trichoderma breve]
MAEDACPVDHKTRDAWLAHARAAEASKQSQPQSPAQSEASKCPVDHSAAKKPSSSWTQTISSYIWSSPSPTADNLPANHPAIPSTTSPSNLETSRVTSTIPRSFTNSDEYASGNWVYPSEKMFFEAMKRKGYDAREVDMKTVVPIHNAVNERAWQHIKEWEAPYLTDSKCDGPRLSSFANKSTRMTPTARINTILGYTAPFDRHDWVIDRCGVRVDYVIDFYAGRPGGTAGAPSFYLDVRPKLNTLEGVKMRVMRWTGLA